VPQDLDQECQSQEHDVGIDRRPWTAALSLKTTLQLAEGTVLVMLAGLAVLSRPVQELFELQLGVVGFLSVFALLSFLLPLDRPLWQRRSYVALELVLITAAHFAGLRSDLLFVLIVLKGSVLLERRDILLAAFLGGGAFTVAYVTRLPLELERVQHKLATLGFAQVYDPRVMITTFVLQLGGAALLAVLTGLVLMAERQSRARAEHLARENELLAADLERTRIAREIHDSLGHTLTTLDVQLEVAQRLQERDPNASRSALDTAKLLSAQCLLEVRRAVHSMRNRDFDLTAALDALVTQAARHQPFSLESAVVLPVLPAQTGHQVYCIIQEGLTNIQRHAGAHRVHLCAQTVEGRLRIELRDDGRGFRPDQATSGYGLRGMRERAQILGGALTVESAPGRGTRILLEVPT
jgi:signal transduction histidine kinase